jgi:hypothetical protein
MEGADVQTSEAFDRIPDFRVSALPGGGWRAVNLRDPAIVVVERNWARLRRSCLAKRVAYSLNERFRADLEREFPGWRVWRGRHAEDDRWMAEPSGTGPGITVHPSCRPRLGGETPEELRTAMLRWTELQRMAG